MSEAKNRVRAQYGAVGDAYLKSAGHATGDDLARMVELAAPSGSERVLDIATGGGHVARAFAPHVASVIASDLTPEILTHASRAFSEWNLPNVTTEIADAEQLPFDDVSFDIVACRIAPHHFPDPAAFVAEVARVLAPQGTFVLVDSTVPEGDDGAWFNEIEAIRDSSHVRSLTVAEWVSLLTAHGMKVVHHEDLRKRHDFADWVQGSRTSTEDIACIEEKLLSAPETTQREYDIVCDQGRVVSFTDTKTLFVAYR